VRFWMPCWTVTYKGSDDLSEGLMARSDELKEILNPTPSTNRWVRWNSALAEWTSRRVLASLAMFNIALVLPVFGIGNGKIELSLLVVSNWVQWWALPALQRSQNRIQDTQLGIATYLMEMAERKEDFDDPNTHGGAGHA